MYDEYGEYDEHDALTICAKEPLAHDREEDHQFPLQTKEQRTNDEEKKTTKSIDHDHDYHDTVPMGGMIPWSDSGCDCARQRKVVDVVAIVVDIERNEEF